VSLNNGSVSRVAVVRSSTSVGHLRALTQIAFLVVLKKIERVFVSNERQCDANQYTVHAALFFLFFKVSSFNLNLFCMIYLSCRFRVIFF